ncbi:MAG TPA: GNAT family N-acetyltransferase [bacterium]|nr:GNAT family N-acetyltransferase [bacterium]
MRDIEAIVKEYFSAYLCFDVSKAPEGKVVLASCARRAAPEKGWGMAFTVWVHVFDNRAVVSCRPDLMGQLRVAMKAFKSPGDLLKPPFSRVLSELFGEAYALRTKCILYCKPEHVKVFDVQGCRAVQLNDMEAFVTMTVERYPGADSPCLRTDITRNIKDGIAYGVFKESKLVSVCDAPAIAHMQDEVEELGFETLPRYTGRGFGKAVVSHATARVLQLGRVPICRTSPSNSGALRILEAVGYTVHAHKIAVTQRASQ